MLPEPLAEFRSFHAQSSPAGAPASLTIEADRLAHNTFAWVHWSYSAAPTGGSLTISDGVTTELVYIISAGPGYLPLSGAVFGANRPVTFTLAAGGAAVACTLAVLGVRKV